MKDNERQLLEDFRKLDDQSQQEMTSIMHDLAAEQDFVRRPGLRLVHSAERPLLPLKVSQHQP
jgi:hypothetical protein